MTRTTWARIAGFMFLFYIATGVPQMVLFDKVTSGEGVAAKLANIAQHAPQMRLVAVLSLISIFDALVLAVALYAITRETNPNLAVLALSCRVGEGITSVIPTVAMLALLWVAKGMSGADPATANALGAVLLKVPTWSMFVGATIFAAGSTLYCYLFLRARSIPVVLAWIGIVASILLLFGLPLQMVGLLEGPIAALIWIPMLLFEVPVGFWLLIKGAGEPGASA